MYFKNFSIVNLLFILLIPIIVYVLRKMKNDSKTSSKTLLYFALFFVASILLSISLYEIWQNIYLSIGVLGLLGIVTLDRKSVV